MVGILSENLGDPFAGKEIMGPVLDDGIEVSGGFCPFALPEGAFPGNMMRHSLTVPAIFHIPVQMLRGKAQIRVDQAENPGRIRWSINFFVKSIFGRGGGGIQQDIIIHPDEIEIDLRTDDLCLGQDLVPARLRHFHLRGIADNGIRPVDKLIAHGPFTGRVTLGGMVRTVGRMPGPVQAQVGSHIKESHRAQRIAFAFRHVIIPHTVVKGIYAAFKTVGRVVDKIDRDLGNGFFV